MLVFGVILLRIFRIRTEYGEILGISPYSVQMWENAYQNNAKYGQFLRCDTFALAIQLMFSVSHWVICVDTSSFKNFVSIKYDFTKKNLWND